MLKGFLSLRFNETLKKAEENMNKVLILSDQLCPVCGQPMAIRSSRFGQFLGCVGYPECKTKIALTKEGKPVPEDRPSEEKCKTCASPMLIRYGRYGDYLACSSEECTEQRPILKLTGVDCPRDQDAAAPLSRKNRVTAKFFTAAATIRLNQCTSAYWYPPIVSGGPNNSNKCPQVRHHACLQTAQAW